MRTKVCLGFFLCIVLLGLFYYLNFEVETENKSMIALVKSHINGRRELVDYSNEIGVQSADDIAFVVNKDNTITLYFGKLVFELSSKELSNKDFLNDLSNIGIDIKKKENGRYRITYWGEDISQWVN